MKFKAHPSYKDSGVEWFGEVPERWETKRLKFSVGLRADKLQAINSELSYIGLENIESWTGKFLTNDSTFEAEGTSNCFKIGDVLFGKLRPYLAKAFLTKTEGLCSSEFLVLKANKITPEFLIKFILSYDFINQVNSSSYGVKMPRASWEFVGNLSIPIPPVQDQVTIVNFLDCETHRINALVEEKNHFIELLKEKRQALISHVVTKGLDPTVKMKDSGVEWLGEVPEHWEVAALRRHLVKRLSNGIFKTKDEFGKGTLLVNVFDIYRKDFRIEYSSLDRVECTKKEQDNYDVKENDLFFVRSSLKYEGIAAVAIAEAINAPVVFECYLIRARPNTTSLQGRFASYLFNSALYRAKLISSSKITTMTTIDQETILAIKICLPGFSEQTAIANFLDRQTTKIDALITETQNSIALLKEHRTALISEAVTGKIDVREAA